MKKIFVAIIVMSIMTMTAQAEKVLARWLPIAYNNTIVEEDSAYDDGYTMYSVYLDDWKDDDPTVVIWYTERQSGTDTGYIWTGAGVVEYDISTKDGEKNFWKAIETIGMMRNLPEKELY